jgi:hypothetical protein
VLMMEDGAFYHHSCATARRMDLVNKPCKSMLSRLQAVMKVKGGNAKH